MFVSCLVPFCFTGLDLHDTTVLYPLPKSINLRRKWLSALKLPEESADASPNACICSKHLNIPAFARCISESEDVRKSTAKSSESETRQVMSVAKLVKKQIHEKIRWKHRSHFGQATNVHTVTTKSQKPSVAFVNCHIPPTPQEIEEVIISDHNPFAPKPNERIEPELQLTTVVNTEVQNNRKLAAKKLSTVHRPPTLPILKPPISSDHGSINQPNGVRYRTHTNISTSKKTQRPPTHNQPKFYIDRQGNTQLYIASTIPPSQVTSPTLASQMQISQATGSNTTSQWAPRTFSVQSPTHHSASKQALTNRTPESTMRAIQAPMDKTQTSQLPTNQALGSKTPTNQIVARTTPGVAKTSQTTNYQTPGSKIRVTQVPATKTQTSQVPTNKALESQTPIDQIIAKTPTGAVQTSRTPKNQTPRSKTQAPAAKKQTSKPSTPTLKSYTQANQTLTRTSTGLTLVRQTISKSSTGPIPTSNTTESPIRGIQEPTAKNQINQAPTTQLLGRKTPSNQIVARMPTHVAQTSRTPTNQSPGSNSQAFQAPSAKKQTSTAPKTHALGSKLQTNQTLAGTSAGLRPARQQFIKSTPTNKIPGSTTRAIAAPVAKNKTSQAPTTQTLGSKTLTNQMLTQTSTGLNPTSQTHTIQTSESKAQSNQTTTSQMLGSKSSASVISTSSSPTSTNKTSTNNPLTSENKSPVCQPTTSKTITYQTPSNHTLNSQASISQTPENSLTFDKKIINLQEKWGIVISKLPNPGTLKRTDGIEKPLRIAVKRPVAVKKPFHIKTIPKSRRLPQFEGPTEPIIITIDEDDVPQVDGSAKPMKSDVPIEAIGSIISLKEVQGPESLNPPTRQPVEPYQLIRVADLHQTMAIGTPTSQTITCQTPSSHTPDSQTQENSLKFGRKIINLQVKGVRRSQTLIRPLATRKPLQKNVSLKSSTEFSSNGKPPSTNTSGSSQYLIDQNVSLNRKSVLSNILKRKHADAFAVQKLSTRQPVPRPESSNPPKDQPRVEPLQVISVAHVLAESATIVIDDDDEILPNERITNDEVIGTEVAKESSAIISLSEKPTYNGGWLDDITSEIQNKVATSVCKETNVESTSGAIKVAVSTIRFDMANKIAETLDKLLDPICESAEDTSSGGTSKKKRTKFECDNCLQLFDRLYKIKRHIFVSSLDPSECAQQKVPTIDERPFIQVQENDVPTLVPAEDIATTICEDTTGLARSTQNIEVPEASSLTQAKSGRGEKKNKKMKTIAKRLKMVAKKTTLHAVKPTVIKREHTKRQPTKSAIITPNIIVEDNSDSDATSISITSKWPIDVDAPRIELLNGDGHAIVQTPQHNNSMIDLDFEQWINSLAPNTAIKTETKTTPAKRQSKRKRKKPLVLRKRNLGTLATKNDQKNTNAKVLQAANSHRTNMRKISSNVEQAKQIPYNSRRHNTRSGASLMVELPNPSYQHSSAEPSGRRAANRNPYNSRR